MKTKTPPVSARRIEPDVIPERSAAEPGLREEVVADAERYYDRLVADIRSTGVSVDLEVYTFDTDSVGEQVTDALTAAARRGVRVRVLVDGVGSPFWGGTLAARLEAAGVQTRIYHPLPLSF